MSNEENDNLDDKLSSTEKAREVFREDPLADTSPLISQEIPPGVDRRNFLIRSAVGGAAAVMTGRSVSAKERTAMAIATLPPQAAGSAPPLSADLNVVKKGKGPVLTTVDEFYKVGPGPSSSHTIGPMRITYDFYQQCTKLPADKLAKATKLQVNLFGSLSATGKGHGTERAALAGLVGKEPATVDPKFLDSLRDKPDQVFPVKLGNKSIDVSLKDVIYDATEGRLQAPEHDDGQAPGRQRGAARAGVLLSGRRIHRVERVHAPEEEPAEVPVLDDERTAGPRRQKQDLDREGNACQRDVDRGQDGRGSLCLHRQDHQRNGRDRKVGAFDAGGRRAARPDQAA